MKKFSVRCVPGQCKPQQMCDEVVDDCLAPLKVVPECFVKSKMLEKLDNAFHDNADILFYNEDFNKAIFIACQRRILAAEHDCCKT